MSESSPSQVRSARPEITAQLMEATGLDERLLRELVHRFYEKVRADELLGPIFAARIGDWGPHLERMGEFWSSVALMTGRYRGAPVPKHASLPVSGSISNAGSRSSAKPPWRSARRRARRT